MSRVILDTDTFANIFAESYRGRTEIIVPSRREMHRDGYTLRVSLI
jgi:hypothetical protein